jgi:hypothetical protein
MSLNRRLLPWLGAFALLPLGASAATAQSVGNDAKCFIVSNMFTKSSDPKAKKAATEASFFYLGRLGGSTSQLETLLAQQAKTIDPKNASVIMQGCAKTVAQRANEVQNVGKRLSAAQSKAAPQGR